MDEPEAKGAISLASRESLDNLIVVVNCNLQRSIAICNVLTDRYERTGKSFRNLKRISGEAGWNVIKAVWGSD
jgi:pyruvate dehydrogenase E1 component